MEVPERSVFANATAIARVPVLRILISSSR
jgi:hypothetical protein